MSKTASVLRVAAGTPTPSPAPQHGGGVSTRVSGSTLCIIDTYLAEVVITARIAQRIASVQRLYRETGDGCYSEIRHAYAVRLQASCERDLNYLDLHLCPDGDLAWKGAAS